MSHKNKYLSVFLVFGSIFSGVAQSEPCKVPLSLVNEGTKLKPIYKLGINVGLGGGAPRLYEFDTGGAGFWASYNGALSGAKQWWGKTQGNRIKQPLDLKSISGGRHHRWRQEAVGS